VDKKQLQKLIVLHYLLDEATSIMEPMDCMKSKHVDYAFEAIETFKKELVTTIRKAK
jgi:hypothetical protein